MNGDGTSPRESDEWVIAGEKQRQEAEFDQVCRKGILCGASG